MTAESGDERCHPPSFAIRCLPASQKEFKIYFDTSPAGVTLLARFLAANPTPTHLSQESLKTRSHCKTIMQTQRSKRYRAAAEKVDGKKSLPLAEAITALKSLPAPKFDQTVTLSFRLGVDPKQSDQMVRGTCPLPNGSGKNVRVLVFAEGNAAQAARDAGAEFVGFKDMIEKCVGGFQDFDVAIATPGGHGGSAEARQGARASRPDAESQRPAR